MAAERWHPEQVGTLLEDGRYELRLPYAEDTELVMDILRYGAECEVVAPDGLRGRVVEKVREMARMYGASLR